MKLKKWVKLPTRWIFDGGLRKLRWKEEEGSASIAGLLLLSVIAHHADAETGLAHLTYDTMGTATGLSRGKIADGLDMLAKFKIVEREPQGRSSYKLAGYDPKQGWAKLPAQGLYTEERIKPFCDFTLRNHTELDAMKAYYAFAAFRNRETNAALMSYDKIVEHTGIQRQWVSTATSLLVSAKLIRITQTASGASEYGVSNSYRLAHLDSYKHAGTTGRKMLEAAEAL
ncbi:hypothetical protein CNY89_16325 [Amaricoccus sp. HAR-UPW-R2A-40]|nr:hypothetical protein CNY89_16325 [Amaricoccus sp. HAR-UPW-R2A-40]